MASTKVLTPNDIAAQLADLDFNVSDEELNQAKDLWSKSNELDGFLDVTQVIHPV